MATVIVTFSRTETRQAVFVPVAVGSAVRTETIESGTDAGVGTLTAQDGESVVEVYAADDCWVAIGADPDPTDDSAGSARRFRPAGSEREFSVSVGDKVAVVGAA